MDTLVFVIGRLAGFALRPDVWIALGVAASALAAWCDWKTVSRLASLSTLITLSAIGFLPVGDLALRPLETRYPPTPTLGSVDGIVVLGGAKERMVEGLTLANRHRQAVLVFTGGAGSLQSVLTTVPPEALEAERFFRDHGMDMDRVILEGASRNTAENARYTLMLAKPEADETWVLVTSAFHMTRALRSFRAIDWPGELVAWPVDQRSGPPRPGWDLADQMSLLHIALKEYVGLVAYRTLGRG